jgi:4-hydroxy-2-oxoglutarate aldolase
MKQVKGVIAPVPTPFDDNEDLALDELSENLVRWSKTRLSGFVLLGSTGEFVFLTTDEKKAVIERGRDTIPDDKLVIAGTGSESTREAVALTRWAGELGVDYAMVVHPFYYKREIKPSVLKAHYFEVAEESPVPLIIYNIPSFTSINLGPDLVLELASHPNIVGIKDSAGNVLQIQEYCRLAPKGFAVLTGSAPALLSCLTVGAAGGILVEANVAYDLCVDLVDAFEAGDLPKARRIQNRLVPINRAITVEFGIGGCKALLDHLGFYGGPPRRPLPRPTDEAKEKLIQVHNEFGLQEASKK